MPSSSHSPGGSAAGRGDRDLDVTIYGATGFTGTLIAEYFARLSAATPRPRPSSRGPIRWAVAGRNPEKLRALAERMRSLAPPPADAASPGAAAISTGAASPRRSYPEAIVAPSADASAFRSMCRRTRVILSASGPFLSHRSSPCRGHRRVRHRLCRHHGGDPVRAKIDGLALRRGAS